MLQAQKLNRILANVTALLLVFMLVASVTLSTHHHHEDHHDEENCVVCQLIEATITTLRNTLSTPMTTWGIFMAIFPLVFIGYTLFATIAPETLVGQKIRSNN